MARGLGVPLSPLSPVRAADAMVGRRAGAVASHRGPGPRGRHLVRDCAVHRLRRRRQRPHRPAAGQAPAPPGGADAACAGGPDRGRRLAVVRRPRDARRRSGHGALRARRAGGAGLIPAACGPDTACDTLAGWLLALPCRRPRPTRPPSAAPSTPS
nr:hypothetical protein [Amycolatopsis granulosa]